MSKCTNNFAAWAPLFSIQSFFLVLCVLVLQPQYGLTACDCAISRTVRIAREEHINSKVDTIVTNITQSMHTEAADYTKNAFDLQGSLISSYKARGNYDNLTDFVLRGGLDFWFDNDLPSEVSTKRLSLDINATVLNGSVWEHGHNWYSKVVNFTTYLQNEYVYTLYEKLDAYVGTVKTPMGMFTPPRYMGYPGIYWIASNTASIRSLCYCLANNSYSYRLNFKASISTIPMRHPLRILKTDTELAVDDYLSGLFETTYMHSAAGFFFLANNTWNVTMDVHFLGTANETASVFSSRLSSMLTLPLRYANGTAKLLARPVVSNCMSRVVTYGLQSTYSYSLLPCFATSTTTSTSTILPSTPTTFALANTTSLPSSTSSSSSTKATVPPTASSTTGPTTVLATNTSTTSLPTTVPVSTTTVPETILTTNLLSTFLSTITRTENTTPSLTSTLTTSSQTSDTSTNGVLSGTSAPNISSADQAASFAPSTTLGSANTSISTGTSASTLKATLKPVIETTTFDPDPFFKASVPVITKVYNDKVLVKTMGTMEPLLWKPDFYEVTIPTATCIVLAALGCMFCLQVNWITPIKKDLLLKALPK